MAISRKIHKTLLAETFEEKGTTKSKLKSNPENYYDCCESPMISKQGGYSVCKNCGVVHDRIIEKIPQRTFNAEDVCKKRICEPVYSPIGPRTVIRGNKDAKGSIMGSDFQRKFHRLGKINRSLTTSLERNLWVAIPIFTRIKERLRLPEVVIKEAKRIYNRAAEKKLTMGRSIDMLVAASCLVSIKINKIPRLAEELENEVEATKKQIVKSYRLLLLEIIPNMNINVSYLTPRTYIDRFSSELSLPIEVSTDSIKLYLKIKQEPRLIEGKDPKGIAAACIYIMAKYHKVPQTQKKVANICHITEITLRVRSKEIMKHINTSKSK